MVSSLGLSFFIGLQILTSFKKFFEGYLVLLNLYRVEGRGLHEILRLGSEYTINHHKNPSMFLTSVLVSPL